MQKEVIKGEHIASEVLMDIALRRMKARRLANLAISEYDENAAALAASLQQRVDEKDEELTLTALPTHEDALREAAQNGTVAILPFEIGAEALKRYHCGRLVDIFGPDTSISLVASLENITQEKRDAR